MQLFYRAVLSNDHMTNEERKIYDMVVRRFLAVYCIHPFVYEQVSMEGMATEKWNVCGQRKSCEKSADCWKEVYENTDVGGRSWSGRGRKVFEGPEASSDEKKGEKLYIENVSMNTGKGTKTIARFTESYTSCCNGESGAVYLSWRCESGCKKLGEDRRTFGTIATTEGYHREKLFNSFLMEKRREMKSWPQRQNSFWSWCRRTAQSRNRQQTGRWSLEISPKRQDKAGQTFLKEIRNYTCEIVVR